MACNLTSRPSPPTLPYKEEVQVVVLLFLDDLHCFRGFEDGAQIPCSNAEGSSSPIKLSF